MDDLTLWLWRAAAMAFIAGGVAHIVFVVQLILSQRQSDAEWKTLRDSLRDKGDRL